jgi:hypothetical protein
MFVIHRNKLFAFGTLLGVLLVLGVALLPTMLVTAGWEKVDVCHVTNVPTEGDGHVINIVDPAWPAHADHGDKMYGDDGVEFYDDGTCHVFQELIAVDDEVTTPVDTPVTFDPCANDIYVGQVTPSIETFPSSGILNALMGCTITYNPTPGFFGTDSFTYKITDAGGLYDTATVTITVGP